MNDIRNLPNWLADTFFFLAGVPATGALWNDSVLHSKPLAWISVLTAVLFAGIGTVLKRRSAQQQDRQLHRTEIKSDNKSRAELMKDIPERNIASSAMPTLIVFAIQWVFAVIILRAGSSFTGGLALIGPLWIIPIGYRVGLYLPNAPIKARIVGCIIGGIIGAAVTFGISHWMIRYGLGFGAYFVGALAGFFSAPTRYINFVWASFSTIVLIGALGFFEHIKFNLDPPVEAFMYGAIAIIIAISLAEIFKVRQRFMMREQPSQNRAELG